jgi:osmotically-inducible protein OsmY
MRRFGQVLVMIVALATPALAETNASRGARTTGSYSGGDTPGTARSDLVTSSVRACLATDPTLKGALIHVSTSEDGVVTLRGSVPDATARDEALELTADMPGVTVIDNQLRLPPGGH